MTQPLSGVIDSHAHIDFPHYDDDRAEMLTRMREAGVSDVICIGTSLQNAASPRAQAESAENIWFTVGTHPNHAHEEPDRAKPQAYHAIAAHPRCVGIGEAGLDYFRGKRDDNTAQMEAFACQLQVAAETGLPIVIHSRDADDDMGDMLEAAAVKGNLTGVMHCFSSGETLARRALDIGFYISFSGILTFNQSESLRAIAETIPEDKLLVETDAPYLTPAPNRKIKRNEPGFVVHTLACLAAIKGRGVQDMADITAANTRRLFHKMGNGA